MACSPSLSVESTYLPASPYSLGLAGTRAQGWGYAGGRSARTRAGAVLGGSTGVGGDTGAVLGAGAKHVRASL